MFELLLILTLGALQPLIEVFADSRTATWFNVSAAVCVLGYVVYALSRSGIVVLREWGIRTDTFLPMFPVYAIFTAVGSVCVILLGRYMGHTSLPVTFWYLVALYPVWGIAQQFALQNLLARNLVPLVPHIALRSLIVATCFAVAHLPSMPLAATTFIAGLFFVPLYHRYPNLLLIGTAHGILGSLVFTLVLGQNQWDILTKYLS
ncbi:MAG: CPBP family glutamic-type intramembrane protease [Candidatus Peribacteraceae bacterium]